METIKCSCGDEDLPLKISNSDKNPGRAYYSSRGCKFFRWADLLLVCPGCKKGYCYAWELEEGVLYRCPMKGVKDCGFQKLVPMAETAQSPSSQGPSTPYSGSAGSHGKGSHEGDCSNCKYLTTQVVLLKKQVEMLRHPDDYPASQSAAVLNELFDELIVQDE